MIEGRNRTALVSGTFFIVVGVFFLLDRLGAIRLGTSFVWPLLLIAVGAGILLGGRREDREPERPGEGEREGPEEAPGGDPET